MAEVEMSADQTERERLVAALTREFPQFVSTTTLFQVAVADQLGIPASDLHCLNLVLSGDAVTPTQLAGRMGMTTSAITRMLDRMEAERLVRREADPHDRRRLVVQALPDRFADIERLYQPMVKFFADYVASCTDEQLRFLVDFARAGREVNIRETIRLRRDGKPHATRKRRPKI